MSTLDVHAGALRAAVAPLPAWCARCARCRSFPHGLRIEVVEQPPVAALVAGGVRTAVAADGVVLGPALLSALAAERHRHRRAAAGERVRDAALLGALTVLGAAPRAARAAA